MAAQRDQGEPQPESVQARAPRQDFPDAPKEQLVPQKIPEGEESVEDRRDQAEEQTSLGICGHQLLKQLTETCGLEIADDSSWRSLTGFPLHPIREQLCGISGGSVVHGPQTTGD